MSVGNWASSARVVPSTKRMMPVTSSSTTIRSPGAVVAYAVGNRSPGGAMGYDRICVGSSCGASAARSTVTGVASATDVVEVVDATDVDVDAGLDVDLSTSKPQRTSAAAIRRRGPFPKAPPSRGSTRRFRSTHGFSIVITLPVVMPIVKTGGLRRDLVRHLPRAGGRDGPGHTPPVSFNLFVIQGLTDDGLGYIAKVALALPDHHGPVHHRDHARAGHCPLAFAS